ncbi:uncharacterized protein [Panulirus ornatus]|uniref:uncharacterized protein isoform X4 n=1 Tax=Panulirus ornatus TaxID=150431 RepID=UPI003A86A4C2
MCGWLVILLDLHLWNLKIREMLRMLFEHWMERGCVVFVCELRCPQGVPVVTVIDLLQGEVEAEDPGPAPPGGGAVLVLGHQDVQGPAPPGLFHDHQDMMTIAEEVTPQISEDVPDHDHRKIKVKMAVVCLHNDLQFVTRGCCEGWEFVKQVPVAEHFLIMPRYEKHYH